MANTTRLAVLIDSDNTTASLTTELLAEIAKYGTPTIKRAYGDWTTQQRVGWKEELLLHAIQPVQQFAYTRGKNSTDSALIIDAMDLLYAGNLPNLKQILSAAISNTSKDDGWSNLGEVGSYLSKSHAAFDPRDYGHARLGELVRAESYVEVKEVPGPTGVSQLWVRLKRAAPKR